MGNHKDINQNNRNMIAQFLAVSAKNGMLPKRKVEEAIIKFGIGRSTVFRYWKRVKLQVRLGVHISLPTRRECKYQSKKINFDVSKFKLVPFHKRNTIRNVASTMGVSKSTAFRWKKTGEIRPHTNAIKPSLTDENKISRLKFCLKSLCYDDSTSKPNFKPMTHVIHVDEKWFNMTQCTARYYIFPGEDEPFRSCQSKRFITKVMFLCAVSRPIYGENGEMLFDGKIGMWPFTKKEEAKRNSRNRPAKTLITKALESVNREVTKEMMLKHVLPAIKQKWPTSASKNITIQWDNAPPHVSLHLDPDFKVAATEGGFNISLEFQPPNSPDANVNDLGWFRSIQSLKEDVQARTIDEFVNAVEGSFDKLSHKKFNKVFLTLQSCFIQIMEKRGSNNYKITHMGKDALERQGLLPDNCPIDLHLVKECFVYLTDRGHGGGLEGMMEEFLLT